MKYIDALSPEMLSIHRRMSALMCMEKPPVADVIAVYEDWRKLLNLPYPTDGTVEDTAFAALHKARLQVSWATRHQRKASRRWLVDHGFSAEPVIPAVHSGRGPEN